MIMWQNAKLSTNLTMLQCDFGVKYLNTRLQFDRFVKKRTTTLPAFFLTRSSTRPPLSCFTLFLSNLPPLSLPFLSNRKKKTLKTRSSSSSAAAASANELHALAEENLGEDRCSPDGMPDFCSPNWHGLLSHSSRQRGGKKGLALILSPLSFDLTHLYRDR